MVAFFPIVIDGIVLTLAAIATLRAASRLERRVCGTEKNGGGGSIGLMDGPLILGPYEMLEKRRRRRDRLLQLIAHNNTPILLDDNNSNNTDEYKESSGSRLVVEASPLWGHTEAFKRAVILGLICDNNDSSNSEYNTIVISSEIAFTNLTQHKGKAGHVVCNESSKDLAIAAALEAGLFGLMLPDRTAYATQHRVVRGGGTVRSRLQQKIKRRRNDANVATSSNPLVTITSWFLRIKTAPFAAIPAWQGLLHSYLRDVQNDIAKLRIFQWWARISLEPHERLFLLLTGKSILRLRTYDPTRMDFDSSISGMLHIPSGKIYVSSRVDDDNNNDNIWENDAMKLVRVRAFAPKTFRDLRNKCFRVKERDYAESMLNAINDAVFVTPNNHVISQSNDERLIARGDSVISNLLKEIVLSDEQRKSGFRIQRRRRRQQRNIRTLPYISFQSNSKGAARAGTFFFFTADGAYMIKTVKSEEARAFLNMLPEYHKFMSEDVNGRNSLLTRICGMYSVRFSSSSEEEEMNSDVETMGDRWDGGLFSCSHDERASSIAKNERVYIVMHSIFPAEASSFLTERFDLKGSTVGRECSLEERRTRGANAVLKDLDLMQEVKNEILEANPRGHDRNKSSRYGICVGRRKKQTLMTQLARDVDLLCRCNVLDYSLLVGVADMEKSIKTKESSRRRFLPLQWIDFPLPYYSAGRTKVDGGALSSIRGTRKGKDVMYYLGIIDFLQPWTVKKQFERDLKGLAGYDKMGISCVAPVDYAARFLKFVDSHVT